MLQKVSIINIVKRCLLDKYTTKTFKLSIFLWLLIGDGKQLDRILTASQRHIHSSTNIFKLAQDAFRYALPITPSPTQIPPSSTENQRGENRENNSRDQATPNGLH